MDARARADSRRAGGELQHPHLHAALRRRADPQHVPLRARPVQHALRAGRGRGGHFHQFRSEPHRHARPHDPPGRLGHPRRSNAWSTDALVGLRGPFGRGWPLRSHGRKGRGDRRRRHRPGAAAAGRLLAAAAPRSLPARGAALRLPHARKTASSPSELEQWDARRLDPRAGHRGQRHGRLGRAGRRGDQPAAAHQGERRAHDRAGLRPEGAQSRGGLELSATARAAGPASTSAWNAT